MIDPKLIEAVAKSDYKENLVRYLEQVKSEVADIRNGSIPNDVRLATIGVLDEFILKKLRVMSGEIKKEVDEYR